MGRLYLPAANPAVICDDEIRLYEEESEAGDFSFKRLLVTLAVLVAMTALAAASGYVAHDANEQGITARPAATAALPQAP